MIPEEPEQRKDEQNALSGRSEEMNSIEEDDQFREQNEKLTKEGPEQVEPIKIWDEKSSDEENEEKICEIEFEVPIDQNIPKEDQRPRRRAAMRARSKIKGWTKKIMED